jgi:5-azacytidine-induced protein 1
MEEKEIGSKSAEDVKI